MPNSNIDLLHGKKNYLNNNQKQKRKYHEIFEMHIPKEDGELEEIKQIDLRRAEKRAKEIESIKSAKKSFWEKIKKFLKL